MKTISIPVNDRSEYLARCLASIRACPTWREWRFVFACEPTARDESIQVILAALPERSITVARNPHRLGCWENTFHAASVAMALQPAVNLYLEDDYLLSSDALTLVDQWAASEWSGTSVLCLRRWDVSQQLDKPSVVERDAHGLFGCGFAWKSANWSNIRSAWFHDCAVGPGHMWDVSVAEALAAVPQWRPLISRSYGIGIHGTHARGQPDLNLFGPAYSGPPVTQFTFTP